MTREQQLENAIAKVEELENEYGEALVEAAEAEHLFKTKKAKKFLEADGSVDARNARAILDCEKEYLHYVQTEAVKMFTREKLKDAQDALSARQSLLSAEARSNFNYANSGRA